MKLIPGTPTARPAECGPAPRAAGLPVPRLHVHRPRRWDAQTGALHIVAAALYGVTALRLVTLAEGRLQAVLLVVAMLGVVGNAGVGTTRCTSGSAATTSSWKDGPPTSSRRWGSSSRSPCCWPPWPFGSGCRVVSALLAVGALMFPVAHVLNLSWLAILDGVVLVFALGYLFTIRHELDAAGGAAPALEASGHRAG